MKKINTLIAIITITIATTLKAQIPSYVPTNGLVAYYPLDSNANDISGNANNGTINGASQTNNRNNKSNQALSFDGVNDYVSLNNSIGNFGTSDFTITAWINGQSFPPQTFDQPIFSKRSAPNYSNFITFGTTSSGILEAELCQGSVSNYTNIQMPSALILNTWYFVGLTKTTDSVFLYINGVLAKSSKHNLTGSFSNSAVSGIGASNISGSWVGNINAVLDDIGVWNRALTSSEVSTLYNSCANFNPIITVSLSKAANICQGDSVTLNGNLLGSNYTYKWFKNDTAINNANTYSYTVNASGKYKVSVDSASCSVISEPTTIKVNPLPTVSVSIFPFINIQNTNASISATPVGGTFIGNGIVGSTINPSIAGIGTKQIKYMYTDTNGCSNSANTSTTIFDTLSCIIYDTTNITLTDTTYISVTDTLIINAVLTGITTPNNLNTLKVYPNPASSFLIIDNGDLSKMIGYKLTIQNSLGQTVYNQMITSQISNIDLSSWNGKGLYILNLIDTSGNIIETRKILLK